MEVPASYLLLVKHILESRLEDLWEGMSMVNYPLSITYDSQIGGLAIEARGGDLTGILSDILLALNNSSEWVAQIDHKTWSRYKIQVAHLLLIYNR